MVINFAYYLLIQCNVLIIFTIIIVSIIRIMHNAKHLYVTTLRRIKLYNVKIQLYQLTFDKKTIMI